MPTRKVAGRAAPIGERMIEVKVLFWTDKHAAKPGHVIPKVAWTGGVIRFQRNDSHEIRPGKPIPFNSLMEIGAAIEKAMIAHGITLKPSRRMRRYMEP
ncbi:MAG: hypothetical protein M3O61_16065 [Gemmatimonadota bacterium]|nr:hypothetical protein [Gemmatimonadota bacterium]